MPRPVAIGHPLLRQCAFAGHDLKWPPLASQCCKTTKKFVLDESGRKKRPNAGHVSENFPAFALSGDISVVALGTHWAN
jgi:hypothetical protein